MSPEPFRVEQAADCSRRNFLGNVASLVASAPLLGAASVLAADRPQRKIKLGLVGCGGRGSWIAGLFKEHGGYEIHALADYFPEVADKCGQSLGVDPARRFSGLAGYKRVIDSGVEAIALETPPCFFADHAAAAVDAGLHVYMAKPVAVDVPGCLRIAGLGQQASRKQRVFQVDYQMPTDPGNIEVAKRIRDGKLGDLAKVVTTGIFGGHKDPPKAATIEDRLRNNIWDNDIAIGGGYINLFDIHAIDAARWVIGERPIAAVGVSRICRADPHGDTFDVCSLLYEYAGGLIHEHSGVGLPTAAEAELRCELYSATGHATVDYWQDAHFHVRGQKPLTAKVVDLYPAGAKRNIATFYEDVIANQFANATVSRAVDGCLTCLLGREAALRRERLTMEEFLKENQRVELDLRGLRS